MAVDADITGLLLAWRAGDDAAFERLVPLVYEDLRRIAHRRLAAERVGHTLNTTALVHEAYVRLVDQRRARLADRAHFLAIAARAMRRILVDQARRHRAAKRGGGQVVLQLDAAAAETLVAEDALGLADSNADTLLALDEALTRLACVDERVSAVVQCRFFGGLTEEETAEALEITTRTVRRDWVKARGWLREALGE